MALSACSSLAPHAPLPANGDISTHTLTNRPYQQQIQISGRITVHYQQNGKEQTLPGSFEWEQDRRALRITLLSPLGQTLARITQSDGNALLEQDGKAPKQAHDLDQLLSEALGWTLPVGGLRDWLQGFMPNRTGQRIALTPEDQTLQADGWTLRYASWHEAPAFPKRIDLDRYTDEAGNVAIRIVVDQWKAP